MHYLFYLFSVICCWLGLGLGSEITAWINYLSKKVQSKESSAHVICKSAQGLLKNKYAFASLKPTYSSSNTLKNLIETVSTLVPLSVSGDWRWFGSTAPGLARGEGSTNEHVTSLCYHGNHESRWPACSHLSVQVLTCRKWFPVLAYFLLYC